MRGILPAFFICILLGTVLHADPRVQMPEIARQIASVTPEDQDSATASDSITADDFNWLKAHPGLTISGDDAWPPFEYIDTDGEYQGMIPDLIHLIEKKLHYQFTQKSFRNWETTLDNMKSRKLALISGLAKTPQLSQYMDFTSPIFSFPIVLVIRDNRPFIGDLRELKKERVGVVKGYASYDYLLINHPNLNLVFLNNLEQGLLKLSNGELDVLVSNIPSVSFLVKKLGISNLKVTSVTPYKYDLRIGVNPKYPELRKILEKAIHQITQQEKDEIYNKWISQDIKPVLDYVGIRRVLLVAVVVVFIFFYWNRKLSKEVAERVRSENALRKSEEQLRKSKLQAEMLAQKTAEANRAKSAFLANMSHEIRTPMNAVMGYTELLSQTLTDKQQRNYLESIQAGSSALLTLINDILDLSKIEAGKLQFEYTAVSFSALLREVEQIFAAKLQSKALDFTIFVDRNLPETELLDETRLRQVLFNLVGNAIKFTEKGKIIVRAYRGEIMRDKGFFDLIFEVEDTGIGIAEGQQTLIFKAFEQQQGQSQQRYGGTGLGLTISRKLVEMMGGKLSLESEIGKGSLFRVVLKNVGEVRQNPELPILKKTELKSKASYEQAILFKPAKVLVVDDRFENRQLIVEFLGNQPLEIKTAENGAMGVIVATQWKPDLILMDLRMPVLDGYSAMDRLQKSPVLRKIPVIAVTAAAMREDEIRINRAGFNGYIKKPVLFSELMIEMMKYLPNEIYKEKIPSVANTQEVVALEHLNEKVVAGLKQLMETDWDAFKQGADMTMNRAFVNQLKQILPENPGQDWIDYIQALSASIEAFDMDKIQSLLEGFPERVATLRAISA
jgi:two-component system sensor histidine kinase EvgS